MYICTFSLVYITCKIAFLSILITVTRRSKQSLYLDKATYFYPVQSPGEQVGLYLVHCKLCFQYLHINVWNKYVNI